MKNLDLGADSNLFFFAAIGVVVAMALPFWALVVHDRRKIRSMRSKREEELSASDQQNLRVLRKRVAVSSTAIVLCIVILLFFPFEGFIDLKYDSAAIYLRYRFRQQIEVPWEDVADIQLREKRRIRRPGRISCCIDVITTDGKAYSSIPARFYEQRRLLQSAANDLQTEFEKHKHL